MYGITYVRDSDLADEQEWAVARLRDGSLIVFVKRSAVCPRVLAEAWAAVRRTDEAPRHCGMGVARLLLATA